MNRFFALFGFITLLLLSVSAQEEEKDDSLCGVNFLHLEESSTVGDFICAENLTDDSSLESRNVTLTPLSNVKLDDTLSTENRVIKFIKSNVTGTFNQGSTAFSIKVGFSEDEDDENTTFASAVMASVSYDFDGDDVIDRIELYDLFLVQKIKGNETDGGNETETDGGEASADEEGFFTYIGSSENIHQVIGQEFSDMQEGTIKLAIWSPFGTSPLLLKVGGASLEGGNETETDGGEDNETASGLEEFSTITFPFDFEEESSEGTGGTGGAGGVGGEGECCDRIDALAAELDELKERVDAISSRLLSITRTCCAGAGTASGTASGTSGTVSGTATATRTSVETATVTVETGDSTATGDDADAE